MAPNEGLHRLDLEAKHGEVWDYTELKKAFHVQGHFHPLCIVRRKADGAVGSVYFQDEPRLYWGFEEDQD